MRAGFPFPEPPRAVAAVGVLLNAKYPNAINGAWTHCEPNMPLFDFLSSVGYVDASGRKGQVNAELKRLAVDYLARSDAKPRVIAIVSNRMSLAERDAMELNIAIDEARQGSLAVYMEGERLVPLSPGAMVCRLGFDPIFLDVDYRGRAWMRWSAQPTGFAASSSHALNRPA